MIPRHVPLVETTRGGTTECVHYGSIAVVDAHGKLVASAGDPDSLNFTRSALKPLQALPFVEDGGLAHYGFGSHELALDVREPQRRSDARIGRAAHPCARLGSTKKRCNAVAILRAFSRRPTRRRR